MFDILQKIFKTGTVTKTRELELTDSEYDTIKNANVQITDLGLKLQKRIKEVLGKSLHIRHVDAGSCNGCDFEMSALTNPIYDIQRFGVDFVASPRHADILTITGGVTRHMEQALLKAYHAAADPKVVIAIGDCACGNGLIGKTYANHGGVDKIVPVDVYVPGNPPRPQAIIEGILLALDQYEKLSIGKGRESS